MRPAEQALGIVESTVHTQVACSQDTHILLHLNTHLLGDLRS